MKLSSLPTFFLGWDVGGWNCDNNRKSRDAIVILDRELRLVGKPWRGNLRDCIASAITTGDWLNALFSMCGAEYPGENSTVTMAIDTSLGFPEEFVALIMRQRCVDANETSGLNRYLFRRTEREMFENTWKPLSAIKDMIGSQATKGMHAVLKFAPHIESCGVWTDGHGFRAIETYPAACRTSNEVETLLKDSTPLGHADKEDARVCAVVAKLFATQRWALHEPDPTVPRSEGWIWVPRKAIKRQIAIQP